MKINVKKCMKVFSILLVIILLTVIVNNVYAEINSSYVTGGYSSTSNITDTAKKNPLVSPLAQLIYLIGLIMEKILTFIYQMMSGTSEFPWADKIVFNAVPMLDVNFINPNAKSLMFEGGAIYNVISRTYATVFTLCTTFFSIAVMAMAIKLATTAIASEKAKYKQAIWDWVVGLVLLFTIHITISFIFYLNETLVNVASDIVKTNIAGANKQAEVVKSENVVAFIKSAVAGRPGLKKYMDIPGLAETYLNLKASGGLKSGITGYVEMGPLTNTMWTESVAWSNLERELDSLSNRTATQMNSQIVYASNLEKGFDEASQTIPAMAAKFISWTPIGFPIQLASLGITNVKNVIVQTLRDEYELYKVIKGNATSSGKKALISDLAEYFKYNTWTYVYNNKSQSISTATEDSIIPLVQQESTSIQNALLYAILVVQSFILFVAYIKRLFYIIILGIMAPVMVVFDFFNKSLGK